MWKRPPPRPDELGPLEGCKKIWNIAQPLFRLISPKPIFVAKNPTKGALP